MTSADSKLSLTRRQLLFSGLLGCVGLSIDPWAICSPQIQAAEPPIRNGKSHMKLSLAAYSFNRILPRNGSRESIVSAPFSLEKFIDFCADQNLDGTELTAYYFPREITNDYLMSLKDRTFRLGLDISGTAIGNNFCLPEGDERNQQLALCRQWIDFSAALGSPVIRIFAGNVPTGDTEEAARERCVEAINQSLDYAATKGVCLALENHGGITATAEQLLKIVQSVKPSPWFGINFDGGNFRSENPYRELEMIAPYTINAQVKVEVTPNGAKQPADLARVVKILKEARYRGYLVLEYEAEEDPFTAVPRHLKTLRELIAT